MAKRTGRVTYETTKQSCYFKTAVNNKITPSEIPVGNIEAYRALRPDEDDAPALFVSIVQLGENYPTMTWDKIILTEQWAKSFAAAVNINPGPLFLRGHEDSDWSKQAFRALSGGYMIGARVKDEQLQLLNYILPGATEESKALVAQTLREMKANILSTSTGDIQKHRIEFDEEGDPTRYAIESIKNQTNAVVEHDMTGSHASIVGKNFKSSGDAGENNESQGDNGMEKDLTVEEMLTRLKNQVDLGRLDVPTITSGLGITVLTAKDQQDLTRLRDVETRIGDITSYVDRVEQTEKETFSTLKENKLKAAFEDEGVCEAATEFFKLESGSLEEVEAEIERIKTLKVILKAQSNIAESINANPNTGTSSKDSNVMEA